MPLFVAPITIATAILLVLVVAGVISLWRRHHYKKIQRHRGFSVLKMKINDVEEINRVLETLKPPFTLEIAVHQLGNDLNSYIVVPKFQVKRVKKFVEVQDVDNYDMYYAGGVQVGAYLKGSDKWPSVDMRKIDFSKVNEIGEGVVMQFICDKRRRRGDDVNARVLVSAPSPYQANEILSSLKPAFPGFKMVEVKNPDFLQRVYFRVFDKKELITLSV